MCGVIGLSPNVGDLNNVLQVAFQHHIGKIIDVQIMGHAFYQLELDTIESIDVMLNANMDQHSKCNCLFFVVETELRSC